MMPVSLPFARTSLFSRHASVVLALILGACSAPSVDAPLASPDAMRAAKAAPGLTVASANPKFADRGTTLDVHLIGSGFTTGAQATWLLHGAADAAHVRTNRTTFVSSTEVVANITVASDADLAYWDVQIALAGGKNGVGAELFEITSAMPVGPGSALGVNDAGDIVGTYNLTSLVSHAFVVSGADGSFSDLGLQKATGISQDGLTAVGGVGGSTGSPYAGVWTRAAGAWPTAGAHLVDPPGMTSTAGLAYAVSAVPAAGVTVIAGNLVTPSTAVYWESAGTWTSPARRLPLPAAYTSSAQNVPKAIAATGDIAGNVRDQARGDLIPVLWRRAAGSYVADVLPLPSGWNAGAVNGISPDGSIMVGYVRQSKQGFSPAFWTRDASNNYTVGLLPTLTGAYGYLVQAYGVTVAGGVVRAVGTSPGTTNGTWVRGVIWTWTAGQSDFHVRDMGGVGTKTDVTPYAINPAGTIAVGADGTGAIKWLLQP
jgi:probable HAF family extracellular repeat protein